MDDEEAVSKVVQLISGKWTVKVFFQLGKQPRTFTELGKEIDEISNKMLSKTLNKLEENRVITEAESVDGYLLTMKGLKLRNKLEDLAEWSNKNLGENEKVLIVEDDSDQAELYSKWLQDSDTEIVNAASVLEKSGSDTLAVIMDRYLEDQESDRFVKYLSDADIPVLMCSGVEPSIEDTHLGFYSYLIKPLNREDLENSLSKIRNQSPKQIQVQALKNKKKLIKSRKLGNPDERRERLKELDNELSSIS